MRVFLVCALVLCSQCKMPQAPSVPEMEVTPTLTRTMYDKGCAMCHGPDGKGETSMGKALDPRPRNLANPEWQRATTDDRIKQVILKGGEVNGLSAAMPANDLTSAQVAGLVKLIRSFEVK